MNEKISMPVLTQMLALRSGDTKKQSEDFLKELFSVICESLVNGEAVKIKDFGVFKTIGVEARKSVNVSTGEDHHIPAHRKVVFVPAKELAAIINEPFEMFETVELSDNVSFEEDLKIATDLDNENIDDSEPDEVFDSKSKIDAESEDHTDINCFEKNDGINDESPVDKVAIANEEEIDSEIQEEIDPEISLYSERPEQVAELPDQKDEQNEEFDENSIIYNIKTLSNKNSDVTLQDSEVTVIDESKHDAENFEKEKSEEILSNNSVENIENTYVPKISDEEDIDKKRRSRFWVGFFSGIVSIILLIAIAFGCWYLFGPEEFPISFQVNNESHVTDMTDTDGFTEVAEQNKVVEPKEAVENNNDPQNIAGNEEVSTSPSDKKPSDSPKESDSSVKSKKVYDTISTTRYLTTMAKDHYGNYHLWPYIYEENNAILGHPDRIKPGTKVVIPDLKKYGVDANNPDDIAKAKKKGVQIYSRYK